MQPGKRTTLIEKPQESASQAAMTSDRWKRSVQEGEEGIYVILCLKDQVIDRKLRCNNEKFIENIR